MVSFDWRGGIIGARLAGLHRFAPGTPVGLIFDTNQIMLFDRQTGCRLKEL